MSNWLSDRLRCRPAQHLDRSGKAALRHLLLWLWLGLYYELRLNGCRLLRGELLLLRNKLLLLYELLLLLRDKLLLLLLYELLLRLRLRYELVGLLLLKRLLLLPVPAGGQRVEDELLGDPGLLRLGGREGGEALLGRGPGHQAAADN